MLTTTRQLVADLPPNHLRTNALWPALIAEPTGATQNCANRRVPIYERAARLAASSQAHSEASAEANEERGPCPGVLPLLTEASGLNRRPDCVGVEGLSLCTGRESRHLLGASGFRLLCGRPERRGVLMNVVWRDRTRPSTRPCRRRYAGFMIIDSNRGPYGPTRHAKTATSTGDGRIAESLIPYGFLVSLPR